MTKSKTVTFRLLADDTHQCENCKFHAEHVPNYCPSCALPTTNPDNAGGVRGYPGVDEFGGSDY